MIFMIQKRIFIDLIKLIKFNKGKIMKLILSKVSFVSVFSDSIIIQVF